MNEIEKFLELKEQGYTTEKALQKTKVYFEYPIKPSPLLSLLPKKLTLWQKFKCWLNYGKNAWLHKMTDNDEFNEL